MVAFGQAGRRSGGFGVEPSGGNGITVALVQVRRDGRISRQQGIELCQCGQAGPRAVGLANGQNPISIVVPCHRVIGSDGSLTGYGGGLDRKKWLLKHEGVPT